LMLLSTEAREPRQSADRAVLGGAPGLGHAEPARGQLDRLEAAVVKIAQLLERLEQRERTRDGEGPDDAPPQRLCAAPDGGGGGGGVLGVMVPAVESEAAHDGDFSSAIGPCACGPRCCWSRVTLEQPWGSRLEFVRALFSYVTLSFIANEIMMSDSGIRDLVGLYDTAMIVATLLLAVSGTALQNPGGWQPPQPLQANSAAAIHTAFWLALTSFYLAAMGIFCPLYLRYLMLASSAIFVSGSGRRADELRLQAVRRDMRSFPIYGVPFLLIWLAIWLLVLWTLIVIWLWYGSGDLYISLCVGGIIMANGLIFAFSRMRILAVAMRARRAWQERLTVSIGRTLSY
jgi:hypothetical protein